jgi:hypothetical protein
MDGTNISKLLKKRNAKKIPGKKAPIIIGDNYFKVEEIFKYSQMDRIKPSIIGFEFLVFKGKNKKKSAQIYLLGKILNRSSSDFTALLAAKLINKQNLPDFKLVQYLINKEDYSKKLIIIAEIQGTDINEDILEDMEKKFMEFHNIYRKTMSNVIDTSLNS